MKLLEHEAKEVFRQFQIPTPEGGVAASSEEGRRIAERIGSAVAVKAQVLVSSRGKAGGILFASTPADAATATGKLIGSRIMSVETRKVLVEKKLEIEAEIYMGFVIDRRNRCYAALASSEGGIDIEEIAAKTPGKVVKHLVDPLQGFRSYHARLIGKQIGYSGQKMSELARIVQNLYRVTVETDAELAEINPLALTKDGFIAADARLNIDDNALYRHQTLVKKYRESEFVGLTKKELEAKKLGIAYVEMDGYIGVIGNGAGLTMATLDTIKVQGGKPGNFLDLGGGAPPERIEAACSLVLSNPRINALFINVLGGITKCDDIAKGIIAAREQTQSEKPIVVRLIGTSEEEGKRLLKEYGITTFDTMEEATEKIISLTRRERR